MAGELRSIPGLQAKHLAVLTDQLDITTPGELVRADRRHVHHAMHRLRPRPGLEEVSGWQDEARDLATASTDLDWEQTAAFVVSFEMRRTPTGPDRRTVVEQAEHGPPAPRTEWPGWECGDLCGWLLDRPRLVSAADPAPQTPTPTPTDRDPDPDPQNENPDPDPDSPNTNPDPAAAGPDAEPPDVAAETSDRRKRPAIGIDHVELRTPDGRTVPLGRFGGRAVTVPPGSWLRMSVSGPPAAETRVALRLRRPGRPSGRAHAVTPVRADGPWEIHLDEIPADSSAAALVVWTPGGAWAPAVLALPGLTPTT